MEQGASYTSVVKDRAVCFRIDGGVWDALKVMAGERGVSASRMLRSIIAAELRSWDEAKKKAQNV